MITIDIHPEVDGRWGDCARSYFLRGGRLVTPEAAGPEESDGMVTEAALHALIQMKARPEMTFQELHSLVEKDVSRRGDENPSFLGNFGHSIGADVTRRAFIDANCGSGLPPLPRTGRVGQGGAAWGYFAGRHRLRADRLPRGADPPAELRGSDSGRPSLSCVREAVLGRFGPWLPCGGQVWRPAVPG